MSVLKEPALIIFEEDVKNLELLKNQDVNGRSNAGYKVLKRAVNMIKSVQKSNFYFPLAYLIRTNDEDSSPSDLMKMILSAEFVHFV